MTEVEKPAGQPKTELRAMQILVLALVAGVAIMAVICVVMYYLTKSAGNADKVRGESMFLFIAIGISIFCMIAAQTLYNKKLGILKSSAVSLADKLTQYRSVLIMYMALCEGAAIFSVLAFFAEGNFMVLIVTGVMIFMMLRKMPLPINVIRALELDWKEQQELI